MESFNRKRSDESTSIQLKLRRSLSIQKQGDLVLYWDFVKHRIQRFTLTCLIELKNTSNRKALLRQSLYSGFFFFLFYLCVTHSDSPRLVCRVHLFKQHHVKCEFSISRETLSYTKIVIIPFCPILFVRHIFVLSSAKKLSHYLRKRKRMIEIVLI